MGKAEEFEAIFERGISHDPFVNENRALIARALRSLEILDKTIDGAYDGDCGIRGKLIDALHDDQSGHFLTGEARTECDDVLSVLAAFREAVK